MLLFFCGERKKDIGVRRRSKGKTTEEKKRKRSRKRSRKRREITEKGNTEENYSRVEQNVSSDFSFFVLRATSERSKGLHLPRASRPHSHLETAGGLLLVPSTIETSLRKQKNRDFSSVGFFVFFFFFVVCFFVRIL